MLEEEVRRVEEDKAHLEEEFRQEEEEEMADVEMAEEEGHSDPEPSGPRGEADTMGPQEIKKYNNTKMGTVT